LPTSPDAEEPSPYEIFQVSPEGSCQELDLDGSKMVWLDPDCWVLDGSSVDQT
jgi:hypothetical protein